MQKSTILLLIGAGAAAALCAAGLLMGRMPFQQKASKDANTTSAQFLTEPTQPRETVPAMAAEPDATEQTTEPTETEPPYDEEANTFILSFIGDCTLGSDARMYGSPYSFVGVVGEDYDYPLRSVAPYFQADDYTFANLETVLKDSGAVVKEGGFTFRGPTAYTKILTGSGVDAVTIANNHIRDYGVEGMDSTRQALSDAGIPYVEQDTYQVLTTERGLKIGLYGGFFQVDVKKVTAAVQEMKKEGAELIILAIHWGAEGSYRPNAEQEKQAKAFIDAGVDIVYGCHAHVLQKIETYNGGIIYYSLGNFCFGGNHYPSDMDTAIVQQKVIRQADGTVKLGDVTAIPCCVSSQQPRNDFQPTPYAEGSAEYDRVLEKLGLKD